ncbi:MAG: putative DNA binding domain-containing protein [Lonepinella koalarum]|nr:putative DNA binding domain-containing protein [Lonepinella koalarum]
MLPFNLENLISGKTIESNRLEFKSGWNPDAIYRSICAFANDIDDIGGGYIFIGVEEKDGIAQRPVKGLAINDIDKIQKEILGFNNQIEPYYAPKCYVEEIDGTQIIILWVMSGDKRPYKVPEKITAKHKIPQYYVRYNTSSIIAKGELEQELLNLANKTPFDERPNLSATVDDISMVLIRDYLVKTKSKLANELNKSDVTSLLSQLDLLTPVGDKMYPKNVALMMFCDYPEKFFPYTEVDIVHYPKGKINDPDNMIEVPKIRGSVNLMIEETLSYLKTQVIKEKVTKIKGQAEAIRSFNYPYQALEEAVVNALYHRNYQERSPVEIIIQPQSIEIISYNGPDRSIKMKDLIKGNVRSRRYRNRRLGDFLKDLKLSEGRGTGIPTIQRELANNGSLPANFDFDEERTYFLIEIPSLKDANDEVKEWLNTNIPSNSEKIIIQTLLKGSCSRKELLSALNVTQTTYHFNKYIEPLIEKGWVVRTEKTIRHPRQRYELSQHFLALVR